MRIKHRFENADELIKNLTISRQKVIVEALKGIVDHVLKEVRAVTPRRSGRLAERLRSRRWGQQLRWHIVEDASTYWGKYVRLGTRAHPIYPRIKKALWWPGLPHPVAWVNHLGTKPHAYHERGVEYAMLGVDIRLAELASQLGGEIVRHIR